MIVNGTERTTRDVKVEVNPIDALYEIRAEVLRSYGVKYVSRDTYIDDKGRVVHDRRDGGGGHSWIDTEVLMEVAPAGLKEALDGVNAVYRVLIRD